jgi:hypothetical protein
MDARRANDRIAEKARQLRFLSRVPMMCECDRPGCRTIVMISLADYARLRREPDNVLTAPDHRLQGAEIQEQSPDYSVRRPRRRDDESNGGRRSA